MKSQRDDVPENPDRSSGNTPQSNENERSAAASHRNRGAAIVLLIAIVAFLGLRQSELSEELEMRFEPDPARSVVVYTTSWCGYCARARAFLDGNGVVYEEVDIEASEEGRLAYERLGGMGVPLFQVDDEVIRGLDLGRLRATLAATPGEPQAR